MPCIHDVSMLVSCPACTAGRAAEKNRPTSPLAAAALDLASVAAFLDRHDIEGLYAPYVGSGGHEGLSLMRVSMMARSESEYRRICQIIEDGGTVQKTVDLGSEVCRRMFGSVMLEGWLKLPDADDESRDAA